MTSGLTYNDELHEYRWHGEIVPSVTQVLKEAGLIDDSFFTEDGKNRGIAFHEALHYEIHNDLDMNSVHEIIQPFIQAWLKFRSDTSFSPLIEHCEKPRLNSLFKYAGKPDVVGFMNGSLILLDAKTGTSKTADLQTAAYEQLDELRELGLRRFSLQLTKQATYKLTEHKNPNDFLRFCSFLSCKK